MVLVVVEMMVMMNIVVDDNDDDDGVDVDNSYDGGVGFGDDHLKHD